MSSSSSNISARGQIRNTSSMGYTPRDAMSEGVDNSIDAHATRCRIQFNTATKTIYIADDGDGMNESGILSAARFHNTREASEVNGLRGFGLKAFHIVLSNAESNTYIITRQVGSDIIEMVFKWPEYIANDIYNPQSNDLSVVRSHEWERGALNREHGTMMMVRMPDSMFDTMIRDLPDIIKEMGRIYEVNLRAGFKLEFEIDGNILIPDYSRGINWEDTHPDYRNEAIIEMWCHPVTNEVRVHHVDSNNASELVKSQADGLKRTHLLFVRSTYDVQTPKGNGYLGLVRNDRQLGTIPNVLVTTGDMSRRHVIHATRSTISFTHESDRLFDIGVNKSQVIEENIHPDLLKTAKQIVEKWSAKLYTRKVKSKKVSADPDSKLREKERKNALKRLKELACSDPDVYKNLNDWIDACLNDEEDDDVDTEDDDDE